MGVRYDGIKLVWLHQNASNSTTITWVSPLGGDLGSFTGGQNVLIPVRVRVDNGPKPTFSVANGTLPLGVTIDPVLGTINGTLNNIDGTYAFTLQATAGTQSATQDYTANVSVNLPPVWNTLPGSLGAQYDNTFFTTTLSATDPENNPVTYALVSGSLPAGLALQSNGVLSGLLSDVQGDTEYFFTISASDGVAANNRAFSFTVQYDTPPVWTSTGALASGIEGNFYAAQLYATGDMPLTYSLVGSGIPGGLTVNANTGLISGTLGPVSASNKYSFTVNVSDGLKSTNGNFSIYVNKNQPPVWQSSGIVVQDFGGKFISTQLAAFDTLGAIVTFSLANGSTLPDGINLTESGVLAGTLPVVGSQTDYSFSVTANNGVLASTRLLKIRDLVNQNPVWQSNSVLPTVLEDTHVSQQVVAIDPAGVQTITYSVDAASALPIGISLNANTGVISGVAPVAGSDTNYNFTLIANNGILSSSQDFTWTIQAITEPFWVTPAGTLGNTVIAQYDYKYTLQATDNAAANAVSFSLVSGSLPSGLSLSNMGVISGEPDNVSGTVQYDFTVGITNGFNTGPNRAFSIFVAENHPPVWTTNAGSLGSAFETAPFTATLLATDPDGKPVTYSLGDGQSLPAGLFLNSSTGLITGNLPSVPNDVTDNFTVYASDGTPGNQEVTPLSVSITTRFNSPPVWETGSLPDGLESTSYSYQLKATGVGNGPMVFTVNSGTLPAGLTLSAAGLISGTCPVANTDTTYSFNIEAFNGIKSANQDLSITVQHNLPPVWVTNSGSLGQFFSGNPFSFTLTATDPNGTSVIYGLANGGTLPAGVTLGANTGVLSGSFPVSNSGADSNSTTYNFTIDASDGVFSVPQSFSLTQKGTVAPTWNTTPGDLGSYKRNEHVGIQLSATDPQNLKIDYEIANGALPTGLTLTTTGLIAGFAPDVANNTTFDFTVSANNGVLASTEEFTMNVVAVEYPVWTTPSGSLGSMLSGYDASFTLRGTDPEGFTVFYEISNGALPPGASLNSNSGLISGVVPVTSSNATYSFTAQLSNGFDEVARDFSISIIRNLPPVWLTAAGSLGESNENQNVSIQLNVVDPENQTLSYSNVGLLPSGLSLNGATGLISGVTGAVMNTTTYHFTVIAYDGLLSANQSFSYTVDFSSAPVWITASGSLGTGYEQSSFTANVSASAGGQPVVYSVSNTYSLPTGLSINSNTGTISGTLPPAATTTTYNFDLTATSTTTAKSTDRAFSITDQHVSPPVWSTASGDIETALAGTSFSKTLVATDPNGLPLSYVLASGSMPSGVTFNPNGTGNTAVVSGILPSVTQDTTYSFTVGANDGFSQVNRTFSITSWFNQPPVWNTAAGTIATAFEYAPISASVLAHDVHGFAVTYSLANAQQLPTGVSMAANGVFFGTMPATSNATTNDTYTFTVIANNGALANTLNVSIVNEFLNPPIWTTPAGSIGSVVEGKSFSATVAATDPQSYTVHYSLANSTTLPAGMSLNGTTGHISGVAGDVPNNTTYAFTLAANNGVLATNQNFSITVTYDTTFFDQYSNNVVMLMDFLAPIGSQDIYDYMGHTITVDNDAMITNAQIAYGNASMVVSNATNDYVSTPSAPELNFQNLANWTVELWVYPTDTTGTAYVVSESGANDGSSSNNYWGIEKTGSTYVYKVGPSTVFGSPISLGNVTVNAWQHLAVVKSGTTVKTFNNGNAVATASQALSSTNTGALEIGGSDNGESFNGYIDDFRVTSLARYSSNFVPSQTPRPPLWNTANNTVLVSALEGNAISNAVSLSITDPYNLGISQFNVVGSAVPLGASLSLAGVLSGVVPQATGNTIVVAAQGKDGNGNLTPIQQYYIQSNALTAPSDLVYSWRFNHQAGETVLTPTVGNLTTTLAGAAGFSYTAAPSPYSTYTAALLTASTTLIVQNGTNFQWLTSGNHTIEMWFNPGVGLSGNGNYTPFSIGSSDNAANLAGNGYRFFLTSGVWTWASSVLGFSVTMPSATLGQWNHVAIVVNNGIATGYMNGVAGTPVTMSPKASNTNMFDNNTSQINGFVGSSGFALNQPMYLHGFNFWNSAKYVNNFTPNWSNYLQPIVTSNNTVLSGYESSPISNTLVANTFGSHSYTFTANTVLPSNVSLASNGHVSGTFPPYASYTANANAYTFTVVATDSVTGLNSAEYFVALAPINTHPVWVTSPTFANAVELHPWSNTVVATDPRFETVTYTLNASSLPGSLVLSSNGLISGTLPSAGGNNQTYTFTIDATNTDNETATQTFTLPMVLNQPPVWQGNSFAITGVANSAIANFTLTASSVQGNQITYSVSNGTTLPSGLNLNDNIISGTPTAVANSTFIIDASDSYGGNSYQTFMANVSAFGYYTLTNPAGNTVTVTNTVTSLTQAGAWTVVFAVNTPTTFKMWGAGAGMVTGGAGGYATGNVTVVPGHTYTIWVGGGGSTANTTAQSGGFGGGGATGSTGAVGADAGSGGGLSGLFANTATFANSILIAGGGGGGAGTAGGAGGGTSGASGVSGGNGGPGVGGSQSGGGAAGSSHNGSGATAGSALSGGRSTTTVSGGGGGGGYFGGGGGGGNNNSGGGGGGGSGYINNAIVANGTLIAGSGTTPGNNTDGFYSNTAGKPAVNNLSGSTASNGLVVIII